MSVENVSSGLVPQGQKASDYDNSDPVPPRQNVVPTAEKTDSSHQGLEFLFSPLLEEYYNPTHDSAEKQLMIKHRKHRFKKLNLSNPFCNGYKKLKRVLILKNHYAPVARWKQFGQTGSAKTWDTVLNCKGFGHYARECRKPKRVKDYAYHKEKMMMCKQAEQGVPLQAEQADWLEDTDEEIDEQELEAHYSYMAKIQEVSPAESSSTDTPLATKPKLDVDLSGEPVDQSDYRSKIGSLMYLTSSKPDLVQAGS
ncbi:PHD finger protein ALFIN-LIKE 4-like protein [Tanacetum coccineum]